MFKQIGNPTRREFAGATASLGILALASTLPSTVTAKEISLMTNTPEALQVALATAFNARDIEALASLFHSDGTLVPEPGVFATGDVNIRTALNGFLAIPGVMTVESIEVVKSGDTALGKTSWQIEHDGKAVVTGQGIEVMRAGNDGKWRFVIDHPFGGG